MVKNLDEIKSIDGRFTSLLRKVYERISEYNSHHIDWHDGSSYDGYLSHTKGYVELNNFLTFDGLEGICYEFEKNGDIENFKKLDELRTKFDEYVEEYIQDTIDETYTEEDISNLRNEVDFDYASEMLDTRFRFAIFDLNWAYNSIEVDKLQELEDSGVKNVLTLDVWLGDIHLKEFDLPVVDFEKLEEYEKIIMDKLEEFIEYYHQLYECGYYI